MSDLLVAAPLRLEALAIKAGGRKLRIQKTGMGPARSYAAVAKLRRDPAAALVVMGVCGGLDEHCEPGDVVVADELLDGERDEQAEIGAGESSEAEAGRSARAPRLPFGRAARRGASSDAASPYARRRWCRWHTSLMVRSVSSCANAEASSWTWSRRGSPAARGDDRSR